MTIKRWPRTLLLASMYMMGILGIVATGGGGSGGGGDENWSCDLNVENISPTTDGSGDIWISVMIAVSNEKFTNSVVRLKSNGSEAVSYVVGIGQYDNYSRAIAIAADGSGDVYAGGDFDKGILRLNRDGSLDSGFAIGAGFNGRVNSLAPAMDGSGDVYVAGEFSTYDGNPVNQIVRLDSNGSLVGGFNPPVVFGYVVALATDMSDDIYLSNIPNGVGRLNSDGSRDMGFTVVATGGNVRSIAPAVDGSDDVYIGGEPRYLARANSNGSLDAGFATGSGFDWGIFSIAPAADGTGAIYAGGMFTTYDGNASNGIIRLNSNGSREANFMIGSGFDRGQFGEATISAVARAQDGTTDVFAGGTFDYYNGTRSFGIARLNDDGSLDPSFDVRLSTDLGTCSKETNLS
jgi:hypothetical protein